MILYSRGGSARAVMYDRKVFILLDGTQKNKNSQLFLHISISMYMYYKKKRSKQPYLIIFSPLFTSQGGLLGIFLVFTAAGHSVCSGGIMVTGSWLPILLKKFEGMCCPYKKTEPILSKGKGRNEFLKKSSFTVMYDREGANGLK
jgi:hypothetical protein